MMLWCPSAYGTPTWDSCDGATAPSASGERVGGEEEVHERDDTLSDLAHLTYDSQSRMKSWTEKDGTTTLSQSAYAYDGASRLIHIDRNGSLSDDVDDNVVLEERDGVVIRGFRRAPLGRVGSGAHERARGR